MTERKELRGGCEEVVELSVPCCAGIQKQDECGNWYLSIPQEVVGGAIEFRLYGPSRAALTRLRTRGGTQRVRLDSIMQDIYDDTHCVMFANLQMVFATAATHLLLIHRRRRNFRLQRSTVCHLPLPAPANGVLEIQTL
jgi:hypothetical protein